MEQQPWIVTVEKARMGHQILAGRQIVDAYMMQVDPWEAWIGTRPPSVKALAERFPLWSVFDMDGALYHLIGYTVPDGLYLTPIDPVEDYDAALEAKIHICGDCLEHLVPARGGQ